MAVTTGPVYIDRPLPSVPRYGLFNVATGPLDLPLHARNGGLEFEASVCGLPSGYAVECLEDLVEKGFTGGHALINADPFVVRSYLTCGAVGLTDAMLRQMLMTRLKAGEQAAVENIWSSTAFGASPGFMGAGVVTPDCTGPGNLASAIGALEQNLYAVYGLPGVLHVPHEAAPWLSRDHLIWRDGSIWRTAAGTAVSIGNYANVSPADPGVAAAINTAWIYITGQVAIWHTPDSDVYVSPLRDALNRTTNEVLAQAEREYVVAFECNAFAANPILCVDVP